MLNYFCVPLLSGRFPVLQFSTIDLEKKIAELGMELHRLRMEGEYKIVIDSLSERNNPRMLLKTFTPVQNYHFSREIIPYLKEPVI